VYEKGWLVKDPFANFKTNKKEVHRIALTKEELKAIANKKFSVERLNYVRDIFLFSCYTGLPILMYTHCWSPGEKENTCLAELKSPAHFLIHRSRWKIQIPYLCPVYVSKQLTVLNHINTLLMSLRTLISIWCHSLKQTVRDSIEA